jgi:prepilin-type N-terminal cleavage/methylation domain-containing protein
MLSGQEIRLNTPRSLAPAGFTLVELLVVLGIVGLLMALLMPAVQSARESGRRAACQNNLKQIALALLMHHEARGRFPAGGWGHEWVGVPGRGSGVEQPGGWIYSVLPYLEQNELHELGADLNAVDIDQQYTRRLSTPIELFVCPSRRSCGAWPVADIYPYMKAPKPHGAPSTVARSDYAINGGSSHILSFAGPRDLAEGDQREYWSNRTDVSRFSGISHLRIGATLSSVVDGASKTYLVGEKALDPLHYEDGRSLGDNETLYSGYCTDLHRFAGIAESDVPWLPPMYDNQTSSNLGVPEYVRFGSAHEGGFYMAYCDGAVHLVRYDVDVEVHFRAGHRKDEGGPIVAAR